MRVFFALLVAALLVIAGAAAFFYDSFEAFILPAIAVFSRRFAWRMVFRFLWFVFFIPLWPEAWRHAYFDSIEMLKMRSVKAYAYMQIMWHFGSAPVRCALIVAGALCAGVAAFFWLILPIHVSRIPLIGEWLRETAMPYLLRSSTMKGLEANLPPAFRRLPRHIRGMLARPYLRLWWKTARWAIRTKQAFGRRALALRHRKKE